MDLSFSIVTFNTKDLLEVCLSSLFSSVSGIDFEVFVIDNASTDGTTAFVTQNFPQVRLIANSQNRFYSAAHNQALRQASGRYFYCLNSDIRFTENFPPQLISFLDQNPRAGAVTTAMRFAGGGRQNTCSKYPNFWTDLFSYTLVRKFLPRVHEQIQSDYKYADWDRTTARAVEVAPDSNLMGRTSLLREIGGWDERLLLYYTEDDLCRRIAARGYEVWFLPQYSLIHLEEQTVLRVGRKKVNPIYMRDLYAYHRTYLPYPQYLILRSVISVTRFLRRIVGRA